MFLDVTPWADGATVRQTTAFVDYLADLPASAWLAIGRSGIAQGTRGQYATASALLDATVADRRLDAEAWHLRDLVVSAAHYALPSALRTSRKERQEMDTARAFAERAVLALFLRDSIGREDFGALYAPFTTVVPLAALGIPPQGLDGRASPATPPRRLTPRDGAVREV